MIIQIYRDPAGGLHLQPPPRHRLVAKILVPEGSEIKNTKVIGPRVFIPVDERVSMAWSADELMRDVRAGRRGFKMLFGSAN